MTRGLSNEPGTKKKKKKREGGWSAGSGADNTYINAESECQSIPSAQGDQTCLERKSCTTSVRSQDLKPNSVFFFCGKGVTLVS